MKLFQPQFGLLIAALVAIGVFALLGTVLRLVNRGPGALAAWVEFDYAPCPPMAFCLSKSSAVRLVEATLRQESTTQQITGRLPFLITAEELRSTTSINCYPQVDMRQRLQALVTYVKGGQGRSLSTAFACNSLTDAMLVISITGHDDGTSQTLLDAYIVALRAELVGSSDQLLTIRSVTVTHRDRGSEVAWMAGVLTTIWSGTLGLILWRRARPNHALELTWP